VEVCTKFGRDWFGGSCVKEGHRYKQSVLHIKIGCKPMLKHNLFSANYVFTLSKSAKYKMQLFYVLSVAIAYL